MTAPFNTDPPLVEPPYLAHRRSVEDVEIANLADQARQHICRLAILVL